MRTGSAAARGYSYLAVLFLVALTAAGLAALGQAWSTAAEREKERELEFRGKAIARAMARYRVAGTGAAEWPRSLDDLLEDRRGTPPRHHLRQRYVDPFTGEADWELLALDADKTRFNAVRSRSAHALLREQSSDGVTVRQASDWIFSATGADAPATAASSASAPTGLPSR